MSNNIDIINVDKAIDKRVSQLIEHVCAKHNKVLPVRFDIRYPHDAYAPGDNKDITRMMAKFIQHYRRLKVDVDYIWVREQKNSHNPHYHCAVFLDGNKTMNPKHVFSNAAKYWKSTINSNNEGLINNCTKSKNGTAHPNGIPLIRSKEYYHDSLARVERQMQYLTKEADKAPPKDGLRNFGMSRIPKER